MESNLEVLFTPSEFAALEGRELSQVVCVVFDVLRATSSMLTAISNGASCVFPVREISDALQLRRSYPRALLAGERNGLRITRSQTGSVEFDLGNSPREFTRSRVAGRDIIMTTTNGTRALRSCMGARRILVGGFLNLQALSALIKKDKTTRLLVICSGTFDEAAYEDTVAAGALCDLVWKQFEGGHVADSAEMARQIYLAGQGDLMAAMQHSRNARRLLDNPDLRDDVAFSLKRDSLDVTAELRDGAVTRV